MRGLLRYGEDASNLGRFPGQSGRFRFGQIQYPTAAKPIGQIREKTFSPFVVGNPSEVTGKLVIGSGVPRISGISVPPAMITAQNIIHEMMKQAPAKQFFSAPGADGTCNCASCPFMAMNTIEKLYLCMANNSPRIEIQEDLRIKAKKPLDRMLEMSPPAVSSAKAAAE